VALTGDAGDELFFGYPRYLATGLASRIDKLGPLRWLLGSAMWRLLPASVEQKTFLRKVKKFASAAGPPAERYYRWIAIFNDDEKHGLYEPAFAEQLEAGSFDLLRELYAAAGTDDPVTAVANADLLSYLPGDLLTKVDVASMSVGLEARSPFLDHPLVEFALTIPARLKLRGARGKYVLKRAFSDLLPPEILVRDKMGFGVPISSWFRGELAEHLREVLLSPRSLERGRFRPDAMRGLVENHIAGRADNGYKLWNLLNLELWERAAENE
ncbi:MAG: asparagine synthetase B, partial [Planctomycetes bacterium]|nr:asparagine synthetase B [Planctomycetota bacterium]